GVSHAAPTDRLHALMRDQHLASLTIRRVDRLDCQVIAPGIALLVHSVILLQCAKETRGERQQQAAQVAILQLLRTSAYLSPVRIAVSQHLLYDPLRSETIVNT